MHRNLNRKTIASAAIATAAVGALGALAFACKKYYCKAHAKQGFHSDESDADLKSTIGPGEINPYVDKPTDPANQN